MKDQSENVLADLFNFHGLLERGESTVSIVTTTPKWHDPRFFAKIAVIAAKMHIYPFFFDTHFSLLPGHLLEYRNEVPLPITIFRFGSKEELERTLELMSFYELDKPLLILIDSLHLLRTSIVIKGAELNIHYFLALLHKISLTKRRSVISVFEVKNVDLKKNKALQVIAKKADRFITLTRLKEEYLLNILKRINEETSFEEYSILL